jgi:hypothetical protein
MSALGQVAAILAAGVGMAGIHVLAARLTRRDRNA